MFGVYIRAKANIKFLIFARPMVDNLVTPLYVHPYISNALKLLTHPITASLSIVIFHSEPRDGIDLFVIYFVSSGNVNITFAWKIRCHDPILRN